eukprot:GHVU01147269.1.p1 GENE.GHVU01147269.1~~GHVU01147269.1.p1  ORF type:complete len:334 (-),score=86.15 GHVU01147269.1:105-1106(-)
MYLSIYLSVYIAISLYPYVSGKQAPGHNSDCKQRVIRMVEKAVDPIEPPKFKHKRLPRGPPSPPAPVQHSPPRKLTQEDQNEWKVPPCVSNWKNSKGYTIPLDKRLQADGRYLRDFSTNDKFAALSDALQVAERSAREENAMRTAALERKKIMEEKMREERLLEIANKARHDRNALAEDLKAAEDADVHKRKRLEEARNREIERDVRLNKSSRKGSGRDRDATRDVSEKVALGQPQPTSQVAQFDSRLFNQTAGMDSGYQGGDDEKYKVYDKPLFVDRTTAGLYRFDKDRMQQSVGEKGEMPSFSGAEQRPQRTAPVEFEKDKSDPFGLNKLL